MSSTSHAETYSNDDKFPTKFIGTFVQNRESGKYLRLEKVWRESTDEHQGYWSTKGYVTELHIILSTADGNEIAVLSTSFTPDRWEEVKDPTLIGILALQWA